MNKIKKIISLLIFLVMMVGLTGCAKKTLEAPVISLNEAIVSWNEVPKASKYLVMVNDEQFETTALEYSLKDIKADTYNIRVKALGDNKKYLDSNESTPINITTRDMVSVEKGDQTNNKLRYKVTVESKQDALGFIIVVTYDQNKLSIIETDISFSTLLTNHWIYDIKLEEGKITIATTGIDMLNVRLKQSLLYLDFQVMDSTGPVNVSSYIIDNE